MLNRKIIEFVKSIRFDLYIRLIRLICLTIEIMWIKIVSNVDKNDCKCVLFDWGLFPNE